MSHETSKPHINHQVHILISNFQPQSCNFQHKFSLLTYNLSQLVPQTSSKASAGGFDIVFKEGYLIQIGAD